MVVGGELLFRPFIVIVRDSEVCDSESFSPKPNSAFRIERMPVPGELLRHRLTSNGLVVRKNSIRRFSTQCNIVTFRSPA
jgi:hypothetical protein